MPTYIVSLKQGAPDSELEKAKESAVAKGGKIVDEFSLIKGFSVEYSEDHMETMQSNPHLHVEKDQEVRTQ